MDITNRIYTTTLAVCSAAVLALAGCGGGGGDDQATPPTNSTGNTPTDNAPVTPVTPGTVSAIKGVWFGAGTNDLRSQPATATIQGAIPRDQSARLVVLEDGSLWGVVVGGNDPTVLADATTSAGFQNMLHGTAKTNGNTVSASYTQFDNWAYSATVGQALSGSVVDSTQLNLAFASGLNATVQSDDSYATPASLSALASSYAGYLSTWGYSAKGHSYNGSRPTLTISPAGALSMAADSSGCSASGTLKPHGTTMNVFDLSLTYSGASCPLGGDGTTVKGIAYQLGDNKILEAIATTSDGKFGIFFDGIPQ